MTKPVPSTGDELREAADWIEDKEAFALITSAITELIQLRHTDKYTNWLIDGAREEVVCPECEVQLQPIMKQNIKLLEALHSLSPYMGYFAVTMDKKDYEKLKEVVDNGS